jgi:Holliday junction resolvasome RuvABC endonuclease subunit
VTLSIAAFDLSLTATGTAAIGPDGTIEVGTIQPKRERGYERLRHIRDRVLDTAALAHVAAVEGPSFGSQGSAYHQLAGLWWYVTEGLDSLGIPLVVIPPSSIKQYATGKGNAGKDLVLAAAVRRFPHVDVNDNNAADALWAAALVRRQYADPVDNVPQVNLKALEKVEWPAITREGVPTL